MATVQKNMCVPEPADGNTAPSPSLSGEGLPHPADLQQAYAELQQRFQRTTNALGSLGVPYKLTIDPYEVAEAFEVPLSYILDRSNHRRVERESAGRVRVFFILPYEGRNIWGATAGMLVNLAEVLNP